MLKILEVNRSAFSSFFMEAYPLDLKTDQVLQYSPALQLSLSLTSEFNCHTCITDDPVQMGKGKVVKLVVEIKREMLF